MSRWAAAGTHLLVSLLVGTLVFSLIFFVWYPTPLFRAMGGSELVLLVMGIDVLLGPLLTLLVFKAGKKGLRFDLGVIFSLQLAAMVYGLVIVALARPVFLIARPGAAFVVTASELRTEELAQATHPEFQGVSWTGPVLAAVKLPQTPEEYAEIQKLNFVDGRDTHQVPRYYQRWEDMAPELLEKADPLKVLAERRPEMQAVVDAWLQKQGRALDSVRYISLLTRDDEVALCIDASTGAYLGLLDVDAS